MNKLTIEEQFLTLEQVKELQELGVDFSGANWEFINWLKRDGTYTTEEVAERGASPYLDEYVDGRNLGLTLSVAEMIEMLPKEIEQNQSYYYLYIHPSTTGTIIVYNNAYNKTLDGMKANIYQTGLRDALFEMLKWLKQNRMI